ncbi:hypothetical protein SPBR_07653 [Sporothrix brasiliensis 5110]|uniref:Uncharacterized protein n=1 Tax=Sporothrix brasiliensis 5110 TaxID=1398154 RepID=A0A0C2FAJ7_9PEZI|nr:uncharacterized protein SPBR_07653 [Sporothrix brasiliensis 5110]KIH88093.1 hypothetical protein SPBR_07653 [Sporothrix brasiliensis 5110]
MSYYGDDDGDVQSPLFSQKTWIGVAVPLCVVAGIIFSSVFFLARRQRARRRRNGLSLNQQGRLALERDILEEGYGTGPHGTNETSERRDIRASQTGPGSNTQSIYLGRYFRTNNSTAANGRGISAAPRRPGDGRRRPRTANRWAWAHTTGLANTTRDAHRMEGLNELGEAPPPYEAPKKATMTGSGEDGQHDERASVAEGVSVPAPAHVRPRSGSGSGTGTGSGTNTSAIAPNRSFEEGTMAAAAETSLQSRPHSPASSEAEGAAASRTAGSPLVSSSSPSTPSVAVASPSTLPPAYSERAASSRGDRR